MAKKKVESKNENFALSTENYKLIIIGFAIIILGFILMIGGRAESPSEFHYDEIFSFRRITLAPVVVLIGFLFEIYAIMKKPKSTEEEK